MIKAITAVLTTLLTVLLGIGLEWALLTGSTPQQVYRASLPPTPLPVMGVLPADFQTGVIFPQWGSEGYSDSNKHFAFGLGEIKQQTAAAWVELPITLYQKDFKDTSLSPSPQTPTPESIAQGIRAAHAAGFKVFVVPFLTVGATGWAGDIHPLNPRWTAAWFDNYFNSLKPYLLVAESEHAEQFALGTEYEYLEYASPDYWNTLISQAHSVYSGALTYDMNWTAALKPTHSWESNPLLSYIGVSEYRPLTTRPAPRDASTLPELWRYRVRDYLDALASRVGKPVILSEVGYRNGTDALYQPWVWQSSAPEDPQLQADAYHATLLNTVNDPNIAGVFFWGWSVPTFQPNWQPAARVLLLWYSSPRDTRSRRLSSWTPTAEPSATATPRR